MARFILATAVSAALVLSAPYIGLVRSQIKAAFPGQFGLVINSVIAIAIGAACVAALTRIRERRRLRYGALALALALGVVLARASSSGLPETVVVERFHFIEYGLVTWLFYLAWRPVGDASVFVLAALSALVVGIADEGLQWFVPGRVGELRDVYLNGDAILCGLLFSLAVDPPPAGAWGLRRGSLARVGGALAGTVLALVMFIDHVHLGYDIKDGEIGSFRSRYSSADLPGLSRDRDATWRVGRPPAVPARFSREDQYLAEALWHVEARNTAWTNGDIVASWRENRILEQYFAPALALGHRWPDAQRTEAETRGGRVARTYVSAANKYPIYAWPRPVFWGVATTIIAVAWLGCVAFDRRRAVLK